MTPLTVALGAWGKDPALRARLEAAAGPLAFAEVAPISRAFAPMVREAAYDISEMALFTFLLSARKAQVVLLPVLAAARFQEAALLCRRDDDTIAGPADLAGKRIGVRAYSQTTAAWLRGILADDFGLAPAASHWITYENSHVLECADPPWCERSSGDMLAMLRAGALDAVIVGNDMPDDPGLRTVFPDPAAAEERFRRKHGFVPVNHMMVVRRAVIETEPQRVTAFIAATGKAVPVAALRPALALALRYAAEQGLISQPLTLDEIWEGLPAGLRGETISRRS